MQMTGYCGKYRGIIHRLFDKPDSPYFPRETFQVVVNREFVDVELSQLAQQPILRLPRHFDPLQRRVRAGLCLMHMKRTTRALLSDTTRLIVWPNWQDYGLTRVFWWLPEGRTNCINRV
jgi:hypothetical protein